MSGSPFGIIPAEIFGLDLQTTDIAVFAALTTFANKKRVAHPSVSTLSKMTNISPRTVQRSLKNLDEVGAITAIKRADDNGRQTSNVYRLDLLIVSPRGDTHVTPEGDTHVRGEGDTHVTQTVPEGTVPKEQSPDLLDLDDKDDIELNFDTFYDAFDHKKDRPSALKAYRKARAKGVSAERLLNAARQQALLMEKREPRYRPHPATWLNGERFDDEVYANPEDESGGLAPGDPERDRWKARLTRYFSGTPWDSDIWGGEPPDNRNGPQPYDRFNFDMDEMKEGARG